MIFENGKDIEIDIKNKITSYLKNTTDVNLKNLASLLGVYLQELKNINEIDFFYIGIVGNETYFPVSYTKNMNHYHFNISLIIEMRNIKIEKIKANKTIEYEIIKYE